MASLVIPYRWNFQSGSLALSIVLSILGFLTKSYFLLGVPLLFFYLFLFENKMRALIFGLSASLALGVAVVVMDSCYECYFTDTFFSFVQHATRNWQHLLKNGTRFFIENIGFVLVLFAGFSSLGRSLPGETQTGKPRTASFTRFRDPLLPVRLSFPGFILLGNALVLIFLLGLHTGNDILYYHQLISPFLLWIVFWLAAVKFQSRWPVMVGVFANLLLYFLLAWPLPEDHSAEWRNVERQIAAHTNVFAAPHVSHFLWRKGAPIYDTGHTEGLLGAFNKNLTRVSAAYNAKTDAFLHDLQSKVRNKDFDLVLVCHGYAPLFSMRELEQQYICIGPQPAPMTFGYWIDPYPLEAWVPRP
jgi:hypothetical protein